MSSLWIVVALLLSSIGMLISLIHRVGMLQVNRMLIFTGDRGREIIASLYPPIETAATSIASDTAGLACAQTIVHGGNPRIVQAVNIAPLVEIANDTDSVIEIVVAVGDGVVYRTPVVRVFGGVRTVPAQAVLAAIEFGSERTFEQDPKYAIRLLVDIAIRALSPAINDPTTAVQALDQIEDLLLRLGRRRLEIGDFRDAQGKLRLVVPFPKWEDFLLLAFDEIRFCGARSVQVMRRMKALMTEMISVLPEERKGALRYWKERLQTTIDRSFSDAQDKLDASTEDRQGLGNTRQSLDPNVLRVPFNR